MLRFRRDDTLYQRGPLKKTERQQWDANDLLVGTKAWEAAKADLVGQALDASARRELDIRISALCTERVAGPYEPCCDVALEAFELEIDALQDFTDRYQTNCKN